MTPVRAQDDRPRWWRPEEAMPPAAPDGDHLSMGETSRPTPVAAGAASPTPVGAPAPIPAATDAATAELPAATGAPGAPGRVAPAGPELPPPGPAGLVDQGDLAGRRHRLAEELAELQWDLGGLAYEMAIRNHFRNDVLMRSAARLQRVDAELAEVERLLRMETSGAVGSCPNCDALHSRGAVFCWQCGHQLMSTATAES